MDKTTIIVDQDTKFRLKEYCGSNHINSYNEAVNHLLNLAKESKEKEKE